MDNDLLLNLDKLHTTELGAVRVKRNLGPDVDDVVAWCKEQTLRAGQIARRGKNWYVHASGCVITINAHSYTVITAHKERAPRV